MPSREEMLQHPRYQEWGFTPNSDWSVEGFDYADFKWTDEPSDVSKSEPIEWVSIRKGVVDEHGNVT